MKIILIPVAMFLFRCDRIHRSGDVLNVVTAAGHQPFYPLRPQGGNDTGRAAAPVVPGDDRLRKIERIEQFQQVLAKGPLLSRTQRIRRQKPRWALAPQIGNDDTIPRGGDPRGHVIIAARVIGKAV